MNRLTFTRLAALFALSLGTVITAAQTQPPSFTSGTRTVAVYATVSDARGRLAPDLTRDDFTIDDKGRRAVLVFTDGVDMPMNVMNHNKSLNGVMKRAEEENVMVYAIGLSGENGMPGLGGRPGDRRGRGAAGPGAIAGLGGRGMGGY